MENQVITVRIDFVAQYGYAEGSNSCLINCVMPIDTFG